MQFIERTCIFDSGHRVLNEKVKCYNLHGHTFITRLTFSFESTEEIGYSIDFKEIKRVGCQWIDDILDHGFLVNPKDNHVIACIKETDTKMWKMSLNGAEEYCNPSAENISKEIFLAMEILFREQGKDCGLRIHSVELNETPNCKVITYANSVTDQERKNFNEYRFTEIDQYRESKGIMEYDDRIS